MTSSPPSTGTSCVNCRSTRRPAAGARPFGQDREGAHEDPYRSWIGNDIAVSACGLAWDARSGVLLLGPVDGSIRRRRLRPLPSTFLTAWGADGYSGGDPWRARPSPPPARLPQSILRRPPLPDRHRARSVPGSIKVSSRPRWSRRRSRGRKPPTGSGRSRPRGPVSSPRPPCPHHATSDP